MDYARRSIKHDSTFDSVVVLEIRKSFQKFLLRVFGSLLHKFIDSSFSFCQNVFDEANLPLRRYDDGNDDAVPARGDLSSSNTRTSKLPSREFFSFLRFSKNRGFFFFSKNGFPKKLLFKNWRSQKTHPQVTISATRLGDFTSAGSQNPVASDSGVNRVSFFSHAR